MRQNYNTCVDKCRNLHYKPYFLQAIFILKTNSVNNNFLLDKNTDDPISIRHNCCGLAFQCLRF